MAIDYLFDGPETAASRLILAHGAGQGMDSPFMSDIAQRLAAEGLHVVRFNFPYMAEQLKSGKKRPPDREPKLLSHWRQVINEFGAVSDGNLFIGGKSMGGRMASLIADEIQPTGLICLGYPFHPPGKPERLRLQHLTTLKTPCLICQGERDTFGRREEVTSYPLASSIQFHWLTDGDHSFKPRKASGLSQAQNIMSASDAILQFIRNLG